MLKTVFKLQTPLSYRFTAILGNRKFKSFDKEEPRKSLRSSSSLAVYPKECNLCSKFRVQHNRQKVVPYKIVTKDAQNSIKAAAKTKNNQLHAEIESLDLIAKEFKVHAHCYKSFTRGFEKNSIQTSNIDLTPSIPKTSAYDNGNFDGVVQHVIDKIIKTGKWVSMKTLHEIYGLSIEDTRYRWKLKQKLIKHFNDKIVFLTYDHNKPEVVASKDFMEVNDTNKIFTIKHAAKLIKEEIIYKFKDVKTTWPPSSDSLMKDGHDPPDIVYEFLKELTQGSDRVIKSLAQDFVFSVTKGKVLQQKHLNLGLGLHNLSGSKKIVDIVNGFGHCIPYKLVCEIEAGQADIALQSLNKTSILPLKPAGPDASVFTHFWVDNFDVKVEKTTGGGSINTTHLMAFQEKSSESCINELSITIPRKKVRKLFYEDTNIISKPVNKKAEPSIAELSIIEERDSSNVNFCKKLLLWKYARKSNNFDQRIPTFKGWATAFRSTDTLTKTDATYLPPITSKVTDFHTIHKYLTYLQGLARSVNIPYVNVTLDVGAAINAYKTVWSYPETYKNVFIHLGCFHFMKENFQVI